MTDRSTVRDRTFTTSDTPSDTPPDPRWVRIMIGATLTWAAAHVAMLVATGEVIPPLVVTTALAVVIAVLATRRIRAAAWTAAVVGPLHILISMPFTLADGQHPETPATFLHSVFALLGMIVATVAAIAVIRRRAPRSGPLLAAVGTLAVVGVLVSVVAVSSTSSDASGGQDATLVAERMAWDRDTLTVPSGGRLYVDNLDRARHTFTVEDSDLDVELPAGTARMVSIDLAPGTYTFVCDVIGHETMIGTLAVSG